MRSDCPRFEGPRALGTSKRGLAGITISVSSAASRAMATLPFCSHPPPRCFSSSSSLAFSSRTSCSLAMPTSGPMDTAHPVVDKAIIVGGGLGGLSASLQLRHIGIDAQVYERGEALSGGEGTLITLIPNGCKSLSHADSDIVNKSASCKFNAEASTGLYAHKFEDGYIFNVDAGSWYFRFVDGDCGPVTGIAKGYWDLSQHMEEIYGQPMVSILWRHALTILSNALPDECKHFGHACVDVRQESATVNFKRGDETIYLKAPLVIGADGIRSVVRSRIFGPTTPRDNGRTMWRAVIDENLCHHLELRVGTITAMKNGRTMFVIKGVHGKLYWAYSLTDESTDGRAKVRSRNPEEAKARLREEFKGWEFALQIVEATDSELILERRVLDLPVLPKWTSGRVAILGDAAHAVTPALGQGANLAFEDGLELALQLSSASD